MPLQALAPRAYRGPVHTADGDQVETSSPRVSRAGAGSCELAPPKVGPRGLPGRGQSERKSRQDGRAPWLSLILVGRCARDRRLCRHPR